MSKKQRLKQIIVGLIMVALGILSAVETDDGTAAMMIIPMGLYAIFTHEKVVM